MTASKNPPSWDKPLEYSPEGIDVEVSTDYAQAVKKGFKVPQVNAPGSPSPEWQIADNNKMGNGTEPGYPKVGTGTP